MFTGEIANSSHMGLSAREMEIIGLVADGLTNQEIAEKSDIGVFAREALLNDLIPVISCPHHDGT